MGYVELVARREGRFSRLFARKRLHPHFRADPAFRVMFLDEAHLAGLIRHPNVTAVWEIGEDLEGPFLLMEYVEGPSVAEILKHVEPRDRLLPLGLCMSIAAQAARGLHAAHELVATDGSPLGLVHRDISPRNLLVGYDGVVRLADFGIAKSKDNVEQTRIGVLKGNIGYMAPEHLRFQDLDRRSDLFALGVVLFELLTRERLYGGDDTTAIARRIVDEPPPDVFELRDVPPELAALLFDLLAKDRELRPQTALAVANQLDAIGANLAAIDGPFDVGAFLDGELADMRLQRRVAVDAALVRTESAGTSGSRSSIGPDQAQVPDGLASDARAGNAAGGTTPNQSPRTRRVSRVALWIALAAAAAAAATVVALLPLALRGGIGKPRAVLLHPGGADLFAGGWHNCVLHEQGLLCWGNNTKGQLGDGTTENRSTPVPAHLESGPIRAVALGEYHTCALLSDGRISCWGRNVRGEIGSPSPGPASPLPLEVRGVVSATTLAAGRMHTCALLTDHAVVCWGANESGQLGRPPSDEAQPPDRVPDLPPARAVFAGGSNTCALLVDESIRCWGANQSGQLGDGTRTARATPIAVPGTTDIVSLAMGNNAKGGSTKVGAKSPVNANISGFMCGLTRGAQVTCWGSNFTGQLGDGTRQDRTTPAAVPGISDAIQIVVGDLHACALRRSGSVSCWGRNEFGAVGDDTMGPSTVREKAVNVVAMPDAVGLALGGAHSCARRRTGAVMCWGVNNFGQLGDGTAVLRPSPAAAIGLP
jgi:alpha-tubulin suppressor-like RCC1 family protein